MSGVPSLSGNDGEGKDGEPERQGREHRLCHGVRRPFRQALMDEGYQSGNGKQIADGAGDHGSAELRRRRPHVKGLEEVAGHFAHEPGPEAHPRRSPRCEVEPHLRQEPVGGSHDGQQADADCIGGRVEESPPDDPEMDDRHHHRSGRAESTWLGEDR